MFLKICNSLYNTNSIFAYVQDILDQNFANSQRKNYLKKYLNN